MIDIKLEWMVVRMIKKIVVLAPVVVAVVLYADRFISLDQCLNVLANALVAIVKGAVFAAILAPFLIVAIRAYVWLREEFS